ncbi:NAD(P)-binding protein [Polychaeton citri CBS 116435]|uniref:NAD(P)-binding protein n=1 Tax=Polychaeton citri CBS 116435 TaxID=1314669 RepID=A0A9P4Q9R3_9PEZI|nr:NAD(P)-binding protein [Polychaeton citri CBS 116435]
MSVITYTNYASLTGKNVIVTGGAEGIGAAAVKAFSQQDSNVFIFDISEASATKLIEDIKESGAKAPTFYQCDVTNLDRLKELAEKIVSEHKTIDVLVNNAASAAGAARVPTMGVTAEGWEFGINVNLRHMLFLSQYVIPHMQKNGGGSIINMGSINWRIPGSGLPVYTTCKAAIMGLTKTLSKEFGHDNIRVNSVMPGHIATERQIKEVMTEEYKKEILAAQSLKRFLTPEEVAKLILFLASDDASAITGSSYIADGGWVSDV